MFAMKRRSPSVRQPVRLVAQAKLPTRFGQFQILGFQGGRASETAVVLRRGRVNGATLPLVRIHSQCLTGDVLSSQRCDCRGQLELALRKIGKARAGLLIYLPQEGRGSEVVEMVVELLARLKSDNDRLQEQLGTKVQLQRMGERGKIVVEFFSEEELRGILSKLIREREM